MDLDGDERVGVAPTVTLAKVYERQGLLHEAAEVYRNLLTSDPGRADLSRALKDVEERLQAKQKRDTGEEKNEERLTWEPEIVATRLERWQQGTEGGQKEAAHRPDERTRVMVIKVPEEVNRGQRGQPFSDGFEFEELDSEIEAAASDCGLFVQTFQSHDERDLVWKIEEASKGYDVLIIDPGDCARSGMVTREALSRLDIPIIEVHPSNSRGKDPPALKSDTADVATAHLAGFGIKGFTMALEAATELARRTRRLRGEPRCKT